MELSTITGVIMDMDGVLWRGDAGLPGNAALFALLRAKGLPLALASNNSSKTPADYLVKLRGMGIDGVSEREIVTSATATVDYLRRHYPAGAEIHVLGGAGLKSMIADAGFNLADEAGIVVAGIDFELTYERIKRAAYLICAGADFIGTNGDVTFPMPDGLAPGAGSILAALVAATDRKPIIIGKPSLPMFEAALGVLGTPAETTLMIGDRLNTDIQGAQAAGLKAALVLTGVTTPDLLATSDIQPDAVYDDLHALIGAWR